MKKNTNRRQQTQKDTLDKRIRAEVDRSRSNAAGPHRLKTTYTRKDKHPNRREW